MSAGAREDGERAGGRGGPLDGTDHRLVGLLRAGASGSEAAAHLGLSAREVAARLRGLRERWGVTSTRRLLDVFPVEPPGGGHDTG